MGLGWLWWLCGWLGWLRYDHEQRKGPNERNERNVYKGKNKGYKVGVKCGLSIGKTKATLRKSYFEGVNFSTSKSF